MNRYIIYSKQLIATLLFVFINSLSFASVKDSIIIEKFIYYTQDSIPIKSTLYLPQNKPKKIIIQLYSTHINYRHPDFSLHSDSINFKMITSLTSNDYGVILISPRLEHTKENLPKLKQQTSKTLADDTEALYHFLRKDFRFANIPIGVWGFSATGIAAAKTASREGCVDFAILISSPSTQGVKDLYFKWDTDMKESAKYGYLLLFNQFHRFFPQDQFTYIDSIYRNLDKSLLKKKFSECVWDCIKCINDDILPKYNDVDSIHFYAREFLKTSFNTYSLKTKIDMKITSSNTLIDINQFVDLLINEASYAPLDIDYLKWNPENYYPKINCPALMLFAEEDVNIDVIESIENTKRIINEYKKANISITIIPSVDHNFYIPSKTIIVKDENSRAQELSVQSESLFKGVINWLDSIAVQ